MEDYVLNHYIRAKEFAASKGYDMVRFVMIENGHEIYNYISRSMLGKKTGWPHYIDIDKDGNITDVEDDEKLLFYRDEYCKQTIRKEKSLSNIKELTGKTIFDFATNEEISKFGIFPDETYYKDCLNDEERVIDIYCLAIGYNHQGLERRVCKLYPNIIDKYKKRLSMSK